MRLTIKMTIFITMVFYINIINVLGDEKTYIIDTEPANGIEANQDVKIIAGNNEGLYNPLGKIDPFTPPFTKITAIPDLIGDFSLKCERVTPLQTLDLSQYQLKAIVKATSGNRALVIDSAGKGYIVTNNTAIGINCGKVIDILDDRIVVEEQTRNILDRIVYKKRELLIHKDI